MVKNNMRMIVQLVILLIVVVIGYLSVQESNVIISKDTMKITSFYGREISKDEIIDLKLIDEIPNILRRNNGVSIFGIRKGKFTLEEIGSSLLHIHNNAGPYIVVETEEQTIIINFRNQNQTINKYEELRAFIEF